jgi:rhodanese-related sulfurtransferase
MDGEISPADLEATMENGDAPLVVDVRQPGPYRRERVPDSVNLPFPNLVRDVDRVADADHVVTVCPHGKASVKAARLIAASGSFDGRVECLAGGLTAWEGPIAGGPGEERSGASGSTEEGPEAPF